jgi:hypothetical protein
MEACLCPRVIATNSPEQRNKQQVGNFTPKVVGQIRKLHLSTTLHVSGRYSSVNGGVRGIVQPRRGRLSWVNNLVIPVWCVQDLMWMRPIIGKQELNGVNVVATSTSFMVKIPERYKNIIVGHMQAFRASSM